MFNKNREQAAVIEGLVAALQGLSNRLDRVEGDSSLKTEIEAIKVQVSNMETKVQSSLDEISQNNRRIEERLQERIVRLEGTSARRDSHAGLLQRLRSDVDGHQGTIRQHEQRIGNLEQSPQRAIVQPAEPAAKRPEQANQDELTRLEAVLRAAQVPGPQNPEPTPDVPDDVNEECQSCKHLNPSDGWHCGNPDDRFAVLNPDQLKLAVRDGANCPHHLPK